MAGTGKLSIILDLDDSGFHAKMEKDGKAIKEFTLAASRSGKSLSSTEAALKNVAALAGDFAKKLKTSAASLEKLTTSAGSVTTTVKDLNKSITSANSQIGKFGSKIADVSTNISAMTVSSRRAGDAMSSVADKTERISVSMSGFGSGIRSASSRLEGFSAKVVSSAKEFNSFSNAARSSAAAVEKVSARLNHVADSAKTTVQEFSKIKNGFKNVAREVSGAVEAINLLGMASIHAVEGLMRLDGIILKMESRLKGVARAQRDFNGALGQSTNFHQTLLGKIRDTTMIVWLAQEAWNALRITTVGWMMDILNNAGELERMQKLMEGMSSAITNAGRQEEGKRDVEYIVGLAQKAPFAIKELNDVFVKLKTTGIDPMNGSMQSLVDAVAHFGGNGETLHKASIAIQQMASKGVISMEELRQQLGEAVPNAMKLMAAGVGETMAEFTDKVSKGMVNAVPALERMFLQMRVHFEGSAAAMMTTWAGMTEQLKTKWLLMQNDIANAGFADAAKGAMVELLRAFDSSEFKAAMRDIGNSLTSVASGIASMIKWIAQNIQTVKEFVRSIGAIAGTVVAIRAAAIAMETLVAAHVALSAAAKSAITLFVGLGSAATGAAGAMGTVSSAVVALAANPLVRLISVLGIATLAFNKMGKSARDAARDVDLANKVRSVSSQEDIDKTAARAEELKKQIQGMQTSLSMTRGRVTGKDREDLQAQLTGKVAELESVNSTIRAARGIRETADIASQSQAKFEDFNRSLAEFDIQRSDKFSKLQEQLQKGQIDQKKFFDEEKKINSDILNQKIAVAKGDEDRLSRIYEGMNDKASVEAKALKETISRIKQSRVEFGAQIVSDEAKFNTDGVFGESKKTGAGKKSAVERQAEHALDVLTQLKAKRAELESELKNFSFDFGDVNIPDKLANLRTQIEGGRIDGVNNSNKEQYLAEMEAIMKATEALKLNNKEKQIHEQMTSSVASAEEKLTADWRQSQKELETVNTGYGKLETKVENVTGWFEAQRSQLELHRESLKNDEKALEDNTRALAELEAAQKKQLALARDIDANALMGKMRTESRQANRSLMSPTEQISSDFELQIGQMKMMVDELVSKYEAGSDQRKAIEQDFANFYIAKQQEMALAAHPILQQMVQWKDGLYNLEQAANGWLDSMTQGLTEFAMTGKLNFKDFARSVMKDIIQMTLKMIIANSVMAIFKMLIGGAGGAIGGAASAAAPAAGGLGMGAINVGSLSSIGPNIPMANGGIVSSLGSMPLKKYATGGIAKSPQLTVFGEGRMPEAFVPLPDGRSIPVTMTGAGKGMGGNNVYININVSKSGESKTSTSDGGSNGKENSAWEKVATQIKGIVVQELVAQQRPGGLLYK